MLRRCLRAEAGVSLSAMLRRCLRAEAPFRQSRNILLRTPEVPFPRPLRYNSRVMNEPNDQPMVSVVMPVYCHTEDHKRYLAEALESVADQGFRDFELVIVDDVSPIDILPIVDSIKCLPDTRILRNVTNLGHAESRNAGVRAAEGELIAFLDHDDIWLRDKLDRQVDALRARPEAAMLFCDAEIFGPHAKGLYTDQSTVPGTLDALWLMSHRNCVVTFSAALARRQALMDIGLFDSRYTTCDDLDAWIKLAMRAPIIHLSQTLVKYRLHEHNVNYSIDRVNDNRLLTALIAGYWRRTGLSEKLRLLPVIARKLIGRIVFTLSRQGTRAPADKKS